MLSRQIEVEEVRPGVIIHTVSILVRLYYPQNDARGVSYEDHGHIKRHQSY